VDEDKSIVGQKRNRMLLKAPKEGNNNRKLDFLK
jgi:hypothetical protein